MESEWDLNGASLFRFDNKHPQHSDSEALQDTALCLSESSKMPVSNA